MTAPSDVTASSDGYKLPSEESNTKPPSACSIVHLCTTPHGGGALLLSWWLNPIPGQKQQLHSQVLRTVLSRVATLSRLSQHTEQRCQTGKDAVFSLRQTV